MGGAIFVVGHRGMLGQTVARYFAGRGFDVRTCGARYTGAGDDPLVEAVRASGAPVVVNCLGRTPLAGVERTELHRSNALFPLHLVSRLHPEQHLLHASSDGVFSGVRGGYRVDDEPDAVDDYGFSKRLGEVVSCWPNATVIRTSIVGPDEARGRGLVSWLLGQPEDTPIRGFTNRLWNGITTLEWVRVAEDLMAKREAGEVLPRIVQPAGEVVSKHELLCAIRDAFGTRHTVLPVPAEQGLDLSLVATMPRPPIREQLAALVRWLRGAETCAGR